MLRLSLLLYHIVATMSFRNTVHFLLRKYSIPQVLTKWLLTLGLGTTEILQELGSRIFRAFAASRSLSCGRKAHSFHRPSALSWRAVGSDISNEFSVVSSSGPRSPGECYPPKLNPLLHVLHRQMSRTGVICRMISLTLPGWKNAFVPVK